MHKHPPEVLGVVVGLFVAAMGLYFAVKCFRAGKSGPTIPMAEFSAARDNNAVLHWIFLTDYASLGGLGLSLSALTVWHASSIIGVCSLFCFALFLGLMLTLMAVAMTFYVIRGFALGKAILSSRGVEIFDRDRSPGWFWATQTLNIAIAGFCWFMGLAGLAIAAIFLWTPTYPGG